MPGGVNKRRSLRQQDADAFFVVPAAGLDADLRAPPPELAAAALAGCR
jgi:hypothetical protein